VKCREPFVPDQTSLDSASITPEQVAKATFMKGRGCSHCRQSGYRGRIGIFEMMRMSSHLRELTFAQAPSQELRKKARTTGMRSLLEDGITKALKGSTTLDEVLSTCHAELIVRSIDGD